MNWDNEKKKNYHAQLSKFIEIIYIYIQLYMFYKFKNLVLHEMIRKYWI